MAPKSQIQNRITGFLWAIALILSTFAGTQRQHRVWSKPVDSSRAFPVAGSPQTPLKKGGFRNPPLLEGGVWGGSFATTFDHTRQHLVMAAELEAIAQRGYLIVGVKDNLRPLGFRDARGNLQGLEIDIARRLAAELLGSPDAVEFQPLANQDRLDAVQSGTVDLAIARVTSTEPRLRVVSFSRPYYIDGTAFVTKLGSVGQLEDLGGLRIALLNGASTIASVRYFLPQARLVGVDSYQEALALLESGAAEVFAADASVLAGWVQEYPQYRLLPYLISAEALSVVMPKGLQYDDLRRQVNQAIARWKESGWLEERAKHWGLPVPE